MQLHGRQRRRRAFILAYRDNTDIYARISGTVNKEGHG
jgi:hypothetical protein